MREKKDLKTGTNRWKEKIRMKKTKVNRETERGN
jgi:hypothetical protein